MTTDNKLGNQELKIELILFISLRTSCSADCWQCQLREG